MGNGEWGMGNGELVLSVRLRSRREVEVWGRSNKGVSFLSASAGYANKNQIRVLYRLWVP